MLFHSLEYFVLLLVSMALFWALKPFRLARIVILFFASCRFYAAWNPKYLGLLLFTTVLDYSVALMIDRSKSPRWRKAWLLISIIGNLGVLCTFKYFNFFVSAVVDLFSLFGIAAPRVHLDVLLPIGISFYTFQSMSYTIDVYRGRIQPERRFFHYALFLSFFPQLVAGPIVRARDFLPQLQAEPRLTSQMTSDGFFLILRGLIKKIVVADFLGLNLVDRVFDNPQAFTATEVFIALYAYSMQIYCDFSGYTDVARGSAFLFGLSLPENFDRPYQAASPAEFWRRWHMTLSSWLRDYVYFPLGGSRCSPARTYFNLWLTLFLIGLWHGAGWTFVIYGTIHGLAMVIHRYFYKRSGRTKDTRDPFWLHMIKVVATFHFCTLSRILFRSPDLETAAEVTSRLFSGTWSVAQVPFEVFAVLVVTYAIHWTPKGWAEWARIGFLRLPAPVQGCVLALAAAVFIHVASSQPVPYIYFQF